MPVTNHNVTISQRQEDAMSARGRGKSCPLQFQCTYEPELHAPTWDFDVCHNAEDVRGGTGHSDYFVRDINAGVVCSKTQALVL